jgi:hypothetical protein
MPDMPKRNQTNLNPNQQILNPFENTFKSSNQSLFGNLGANSNLNNASPFITSGNMKFNFNVNKNESIQKESDQESGGEEEDNQEEEKKDNEVIIEARESNFDKVFKGKVDRMYQLKNNKFCNRVDGDISIEVSKTDKSKAYIVLRNPNGMILQKFNIRKDTETCNVDRGEVVVKMLIYMDTDKPAATVIRLAFNLDIRERFIEAMKTTINNL